MLTVALSVYKKLLSTDCQGRGSQPLDRHLPSPNIHPGIQNKANVPSHQPGLFIGFWAVSRRTPTPFTLWPSMVSLGTITAPVMVRGEWIFYYFSAALSCTFLVSCLLFSAFSRVYTRTQSLSHVPLFATPWTVAWPGSFVHGIF